MSKEGTSPVYAPATVSVESIAAILSLGAAVVELGAAVASAKEVLGTRSVSVRERLAQYESLNPGGVGRIEAPFAVVGYLALLVFAGFVAGFLNSKYQHLLLATLALLLVVNGALWPRLARRQEMDLAGWVDVPSAKLLRRQLAPVLPNPLVGPLATALGILGLVVFSSKVDGETTPVVRALHIGAIICLVMLIASRVLFVSLFRSTSYYADDVMRWIYSTSASPWNEFAAVALGVGVVLLPVVFTLPKPIAPRQPRTVPTIVVVASSSVPISPSSIEPAPTASVEVTPPPDPWPSDLGIEGRPIANVECTGEYIVVAFASTKPEGYRAAVQNYLAVLGPTGQYLRTDQSCDAIHRPLEPGEAPIFWAYLGPFATVEDACVARKPVLGAAPDAYVRPLGPGGRSDCP